MAIERAHLVEAVVWVCQATCTQYRRTETGSGGMASALVYLTCRVDTKMELFSIARTDDNECIYIAYVPLDARSQCAIC